MKWELVGYRDEGIDAAHAQTLIMERIRDIKRGTLSASKGLTLDDGFKMYLTAQRNNKVSTRACECRYNKHIRKALGHRKLTEIKMFDLEQFKGELIELDLTGATVNHYLGIINRIYQTAIEFEVFEGTIPKAKRLRVQNERDRILFHDEVKILLEALKSKNKPDLYVQAAIGIFAGLRTGEIHNLYGRDIDLRRRELKVVRTLIRTKGKTRTVPICDELFNVLKIHPMSINEKIIKKHYRQLLQATIDELGFNDGIEVNSPKKVTPHTFRHTFISWLINQGVSLSRVQKYSGHNTLKSLERYIKVPDQGDHEILNEMSSNYNKQTIKSEDEDEK